MKDLQIGILYRTKKGVNVHWILEESYSEKRCRKGKSQFSPNSKETTIDEYC